MSFNHTFFNLLFQDLTNNILSSNPDNNNKKPINNNIDPYTNKKIDLRGEGTPNNVVEDVCALTKICGCPRRGRISIRRDQDDCKAVS